MGKADLGRGPITMLGGKEIRIVRNKSLWIAFIASAALIAQAKTTVDDWDFTSYNVTPYDTTPRGVVCPDAIGCDGTGKKPGWGLFAPNAVHVLCRPYYPEHVHHSKLLIMLGGGNSTPDEKEYPQIYRVAAV